MKKILQRFKQVAGDYLTYNRSEQRGVFVLGLLLLGLIITNAVIPSGTTFTPPDFSVFNKEVLAFETAWKKASDSDSIARTERYSTWGSRYPSYRRDSSKRMNFQEKLSLMIELNSADTFDLQQLRGIGPGFARRIAGYKEKLGGYYQKEQLLEVFGMDSSRYNAISAHVFVNPDSVHPMDLNKVSFKELLRHPYFPFPVTKRIMVYRQKQKVIKNLDELRSIEGISDSLFRRMIIYLRIGP